MRYNPLIAYGERLNDLAEKIVDRLARYKAARPDLKDDAWRRIQYDAMCKGYMKAKAAGFSGTLDQWVAFVREYLKNVNEQRTRGKRGTTSNSDSPVRGKERGSLQ